MLVCHIAENCSTRSRSALVFARLVDSEPMMWNRDVNAAIDMLNGSLDIPIPHHTFTSCVVAEANAV